MGRPWEIRGTVKKGNQRGRKIGFPTCNINLNEYIIPRLGVYSIIAETDSFRKKGIANIGYRPTFNGQNLLLEVNIFGINKNLYNKVIKVYFLKFIRAEKKFKNLEHLRKQIKLDVKTSKKIMSKETLQLPKTAFSMKASLPLKEPEILKKWEKNKIFEKLEKNPREKKNSFFMTVRHMRMVIYIWARH